MPKKRRGTEPEQIQRERFETLRSFLRRASVKWPPRLKALRAARTAYVGQNKRQKWQYQCNICNQWFLQREVVLDHIKPCGTFLCKEDWMTFGESLFCNQDGFQVICRVCHTNVKTKEDRERGWK